MTDPVTIPIRPDAQSEAASVPSPPLRWTSSDDGWRWSEKQQRHYVPRRGSPGIVYREGKESVEEAHARDAKGPKDKRPKRKPKIAKAPAPTTVSLQELELALAESLQAPAMLAAMHGDEWAADHFTQTGPVLARNLVNAAAHNPWLRAKLEATLAGDTLIIRMMTLMPVASALVGYLLPPVIYYLDPAFIPAQAREMFRVPDRDAQKESDDAAAPPGAAAAAPAAAPAAAAA